jgi:hypothetical protein
MNELHALLGFVAGLGSALFVERCKETRRRLGLIRVVEWQLEAFVDACEWALQSKIWDPINVENFATFIVQTFQRQPDLILAARRKATQKALANTYAEASAILALIALHRQQAQAGRVPYALDAGNYEGLIKRLRDTLELLRRARRWLLFAG